MNDGTKIIYQRPQDGSANGPNPHFTFGPDGDHITEHQRHQRRLHWAHHVLAAPEGKYCADALRVASAINGSKPKFGGSND